VTVFLAKSQRPIRHPAREEAPLDSNTGTKLFLAAKSDKYELTFGA
jgi:hypothetical protein